MPWKNTNLILVPLLQAQSAGYRPPSTLRIPYRKNITGFSFENFQVVCYEGFLNRNKEHKCLRHPSKKYSSTIICFIQSHLLWAAVALIHPCMGFCSCCIFISWTFVLQLCQQDSNCYSFLKNNSCLEMLHCASNHPPLNWTAVPVLWCFHQLQSRFDTSN